MSRKQVNYQRYKESLKKMDNETVSELYCSTCQSQFLLLIPYHFTKDVNSARCGSMTLFKSTGLSLQECYELIGRDFCRCFGPCKIESSYLNHMFKDYNKDSFILV